MAKQYILWLTTATLFLATSTSAAPFQNERSRPITQCAVTCPDPSNMKFQYSPGKTYEYAYESDIKTSVAKMSLEHSSLHMRATVYVDVLSTCEMSLRLSDVSLQDADPTNYERRQQVRDMSQFQRALQDKAMSFAFIDGRIDSVCPRSDDDVWAVNIRRGILSTLQNTMSRLQGMSKTRETDISGNCPVKYEVTANSGQTIKIKKTKDLMGCTERHDTQTIFQGIPYTAESEIQSLPLMASTYNCEQEVNAGSPVISKSSCVETHSFRPFAKLNSGATTELSYKLTLRREFNSNQIPDGSPRIRSTILFDHTMTKQQTAETLRETQQIFQMICQKIQVDIRPEVPALFTKVVHQMKRLETQSLSQLLNLVKGSSLCQKAEKFYRDALPLLGTTAAVSTMRQLIRDNKATDQEVQMWLSSIGFIKNPTSEMIRELKPLVQSHMRYAALPVSALINTFVQLNGNDATNNDVVQIINLFETSLKYNCRTGSDEDTANILTALRAIGNAGLAAHSAVASLTRCAMNEATPMSIRVTAINAFRRIDCKTSSRYELLRLLENRQGDSELRINAYLAVMQCASEATLTSVKSVLESDEVNQVLSFIWTHLTNLQETSSPLKREIRAILENAELKKEFDMDKRKFSRNIELSTFSELLNVGATVESNLIWSGQSFVPRSASLNLTVDMFGQSVNLVEFGGRVQGVEDILEKLLGPGSDLDNAIKYRKRDKRVPFRDEFFNSIDRTFNKQPDTDQLSYYIRVFGNEIRAGDIFSFDFEQLKSKFNFFDWLIELAKEHNIDMTKSIHFLDANVVVPTGSGFPLRLNAEGSTTIGLQAKGKIDIRQLLSKPSSFDVNGSIKPSAAVEIRASMGVDGYVASTGLKVVNTLHSSTVLDGALQLRDGRVFNFDWNLPQDKVEVFSAESHVYVTHREQDREQTPVEGQSWNYRKCTNRDTANKVGLEMCGELTVPKGALGPFVARLYINKLETYKGLHFDASYVQSQADDAEKVRVSFNTPESRTDRELTAEFTLRRAQRQFQLNVKTPWKRVDVEGSLVDNTEMKKAELKAVLDGTTEYSVSAEVQIESVSSQETKYTPKLRVVIPDRPQIQLNGEVSINPQRYSVRLGLTNALEEPITVQGSIQIVEKMTSTKYDVSMQLGAPQFRGTLTGYTSRTVENSMKTWASRAVLQYTYRGGQREQIILNHKIRDQSVSNLKTYSTDCSWTSTLWPRYNGQAGVELSFSANSVRTKIEVGLDEVRKLTIITSGAHDLYGRDKKVNGLLKVTLPYKDWNYEVKVEHINNWDSLQTNATVRSGEAGPRQQVGTIDIGLRKESEHPLSVFGEAKLKYPGREMIITEALVERAPREYANTAFIQWQSGQSARIESTYKMQPRHAVTNKITISGVNQPILINGHILPNPQNAQGYAEVIHQGKKYFFEGNWVLQGGLDRFNARVGAQVSIDRRGISFSADASRRSDDINGNVEFVYDGTRRYVLNSQVTTSLSEPKFQTRLEWPERNFIQLEGAGKYQTQGRQSTPSDVEAKLKLTSSLEPIRLISIGATHRQNVNGFKTNGELSYGDNKKVTGELAWNKTGFALTLTTPFTGYRNIKADTSYSSQGMSGTLNARIAWDGPKAIVIQLSGDANHPSRQVTGSATFNSPFRGFESLTANIRHIAAENRYTTNADYAWGPRKQVTLESTINHQSNGWYMTSIGDVVVTTPFSGVRRINSKWQHQNTANSWKCKNELQFDGRKFAADIDMMKHLTDSTKRLTGRMMFQVPVLAEWLQNASVSLNYQQDLNALKSIAKSEVIYGKYKLGYEHDFNIDPSNAFVVKAKLTTPFRPIQEVGFGMNNRRQGSGWTANNELIMGSHGRIGLDGSYHQNGNAIDVSATLTTPYRRMERTAANIRTQKQRDGVWIAHTDFQYDNGKEIAFDGKLGLESPQKIAEIAVRSPCPRLREARATATFSGAARNFQASVELSHNDLGRDKITVTIAANTADVHNMNVQLTTRTPFTEFSLFEVNGRHVRDSSEHTSTTASWSLNRYTGSALIDMKARNWVDFDSRYELEYTRGRKLELTTSFKLDPKIVATASFKSPFESARTVTASFNQEGPLDNFRSSSELTHNGVNKYTTGFDFTYRPNSIQTSFRLTTPHRQVNRAVGAFIFNGHSTKFNFDTSFELNGQRLSKNMNFQLGEGPILTISGKLDSPYGSVRSITYSINHNGPATDFTNNLSIDVDGSVITSVAEFRASSPSIKYELITPYQPLTQVTLSHTTKAGPSFSGWQNNALVVYNRQRYTGESNLGWRGKEMKARVALNLPEEYSFDIVHTAETATNYNAVYTLRLDETVMKETTSLKLTPALIDYSAKMESNIPGYERAEIVFKHEASQVGFRMTGTLTTSNPLIPRIYAELSHRYTSKTSFTTTMKVQLPLESVRQITATLNHRGTVQDLTSSASITVDNRPPITGTVTYKKTNRQTEGTFSLQTPFEEFSKLAGDFQLGGNVPNNFILTGKVEYTSTVLPGSASPTSIRLEHNGSSRTQFKTIVDVTVSTDKYSATLEHNGNSENYRSSVKLVTPALVGSRGTETYEASIEHQGSGNMPRSSITLKGPSTYQLTATKTGTLQSLQLNGELLTPIASWERTQASWSHNYNLPTIFEMRGSVITSISGYERMSAGVTHSGTGAKNFRTTASFESSIPGYQRMSATFSNAIDRYGGAKTSAEVETSISGYSKFSVTSDLSFSGRGWRWTATTVTPISGYERWSATIEHASNSTGFRTSVQTTTPIRDYQNFGFVVSHNGLSGEQFQTMVQLTTPSTAAPQVDIILSHRSAGITDFSTGLTVQYGQGKKMEALVAYKNTDARGESKHDGTIKLTTNICSFFRDFIVTASHNRKPVIKSGAMTVIYNGDKKVDFDYSYATSGDHSVNINIRSPQSISTDLKVGNDGQGSAIVNWNREQIKFDFGLKNIVNSSLTDRYLNFRVTAPSYRRTVGFGVGYTASNERYASRAELYWDADPQPDFEYSGEVTVKMSPRRDPIGYEGRLRLASDYFSTDNSFNHQILMNGKRYMTNLVLNGAERLTVTSELNIVSPNSFNHVLTVKHPKFSKDVTLVTEQSANGVKVTLEYERQSWVFQHERTTVSTPNGLKHTKLMRLANPSSNLDVQLTGECTISQSNGVTTSAVALQYYMSRYRRMKTLAALRTEINKLGQEVKIELETPIDTMKLTTKNREVDAESGILRYDVTYECSHMYVGTAIDLNCVDRSLNVKFHTTRENYVEVFTQAMSPTQLILELSHTTNNNKVMDAQMSTSYSDDERLYTGRSFVRPDLPNDIRSSLDQYKGVLTSRRDLIKSQVDSFVSTMQEDSRFKSRSLEQAVVVPLQKIKAYVSAEVNGKIDSMTSAFNTMYRNNEFYIRDTHVEIMRNNEEFSRYVTAETADLRRHYAEWSESFSQKLDEISDAFNSWNADVQEGLSEYWAEVAERYQLSKPDFEKIRQCVEDLIDKTKAKLTEFFDNLRMSRSFQNFLDRLVAMNPSKHIIPPSQWQSKLEAAANKVDEWLQELFSKPEAHYFRDWLVKTMQDSRWMYQLIGLEQQYNEWVAQLSTMTWQSLKTKLQGYINEYLQPEKTKWTAWDPRRGEYAFQVFVPVILPDITVMNHFDPRPVLSQAKTWVNRQLPASDTTLIDIAYAYKPPSDIREWVPPFKAHASLSGAQHYMTFDRRFFEFAGDCSYLLARDFIDGTFSVVVNYDRPVRNQPTKKSLTIALAGRQVEVYPDSKVTVDGARVELPVRVGNATVLRRGNLISVSDDWRGVDITCDLPHDHCTLAVSGWYYGKTAGLFGTYDNEPSTDFTKSDKLIGSNPESFAASWTVGRPCGPVNRALVVAPQPNSRRYRACAELFANVQTSIFRSCFRIVDPASFMTMCQNNVQPGDNSLEAESDVCKTAAAYVHECKRHEIHLRMPKTCVRCEVPNSDEVFHELEQITLDEEEDIPRAADVVFVVQHSACNRGVLDKLSGLADGIDKAMRAEGITTTRYAVVGFGGKKVHLTGAHVHTMDGQIFNSALKLSLALNGFDTDGSDEADAMEALSYTARLPFSTGASKSIVLVGCDACREATIRYSDIQRILLNNDIHLHVLVQETIRLKSKSPKTAYIYGTDQDTVYTRKDVAGDELAGEPDLRRYIRLPKDLCVALTMDTDGSVFSVRQWLDSRPLVQKQFVDVLVRTLARKAIPTDCQVCECMADEAQVGFSQCRSCNRRDPVYWLPPTFDEDDVDSDATSSVNVVPDNSSRVTTPTPEISPPFTPTRPGRRIPIRVRPTPRRPVGPPRRGGGHRRPPPPRSPRPLTH